MEYTKQVKKNWTSYYSQLNKKSILNRTLNSIIKNLMVKFLKKKCLFSIKMLIYLF
jgi:hypothetical protein